MENYSWPNAMVPCASRELAHAIGVININWNWCEFILEEMIAAFLGISVRVCARITNPMQNRTRCELLGGLVNEEERLTDAKREAYHHFIKCFDICRENRNLLSHSLLISEHEETDDPVLVNTKAGLDLRERVVPISADIFETAAREMHQLFDYGAQIMEEGRIGIDDEPEPLPEKLPLPRKLTQLLPARIIELHRPESSPA